MSDEFDAVERLEKFYGKIPEEEKTWIDDYTFVYNKVGAIKVYNCIT